MTDEELKSSDRFASSGQWERQSPRSPLWGAG